MRKYTKEEKTLKQIQHSEKKHLRRNTKVNYKLTADLIARGDLNTDFRKYLVTKEYAYLSDTSKVFPLYRYGEYVKGWFTKANNLIDVFHERHAMRAKLDKQFREDSLYEQMEQVFYGIMAQFLHAVNFFQYDRVTDNSYRSAAGAQVFRLLNKAGVLLEHYGSYLSLQGAAAFSDSSEEISGIQLAVESMQDALRESSDY